MSHFISGNRIGLNINVMVDGNMYQKRCSNEGQADDLFRKVLTAIEEPSDANIDAVLEGINNKYRLAKSGGILEFDAENGNVYLAGTNIPMPESLSKTIDEYLEKKYPISNLKNFWVRLMKNTIPSVRESLFDFLNTYKYSITKSGKFLAYKAVTHKQKIENDIASFVSNQQLKMLKWKKSPKGYEVYKNSEGELAITKTSTFSGWDLDEKNFQYVGNLGELIGKLDELVEDINATVYTDKHTKTMDIRLGKPVRQERKHCDDNPKNECSNGLHVGSTGYVENFTYGDDTVLLCVVDPINVVAVPDYDRSKMRVCEYFPFAVLERLTDEDGNLTTKFETIETPYSEIDYDAYEEEYVSDLMNDLTLKEYRTKDEEEILKLLEKRVIELSIEEK